MPWPSVAGSDPVYEFLACLRVPAGDTRLIARPKCLHKFQVALIVYQIQYR